MVYKFFERKTSGSGIKNENIPNKKFNKRKVHSPFIDSIRVQI